MDQQNKTYSNFLSFLNEWGKQFEDLKNILLYLNTYPELLSNIELQNLHDSESIIPEQEDWVRISQKFDHQLENEFFKPYWVPIVRDSLDYFIDLSDDNYPIFETHFIFFEPYNWHKRFLVEDIRSLLLASDENVNLQQIIEKNDGKRWEQVDDFFEQRRKMAFEGSIPIEEVSKLELLPEDSNDGDIKISRAENTIQITEVSSIIIGLLPFDLKIEIRELSHRIRKPLDNLPDVKLIRDMVFLLRSIGFLGVKSYYITLKDRPGSYISFYGDRVEFRIDKKLAKILNEKLNNVLKT